MGKNFLSFATGLLFCSNLYAGAVCNMATTVSSIVPSTGVAGVYLNGLVSGCSCSGGTSTTTMAWVDTNTDAGRAIFSTLVAAKLNTSNVLATLEDNLGQGATGNQSVTYRAWDTCKIQAVELK